MEYIEDYFVGLKNHRIYYQIWKPEKPKAIIQIIHGGFEHLGRYNFLVEKLTTNDFIVCGNDHRGHGKSEGKRNHIKSFDEYEADCYTFTKIIKKKYPNFPIFILGHSLGSCVAQRYAIHHQDELKGIILAGTGTGIPFVSLPLQIVARIMSKLYPSFKASSNFDPYEISTDPESISNYMNDPLINYKTASAGMAIAFMDHYKEIKAKIGDIHIPILIQKGDLDTIVVGLDELNSDLKSKDKTIKIYKDCKHEVYTESKDKRDNALSDLNNWINSHL